MPVTVTAYCLMCSAPVESAPGVCSLSCALSANNEIRRNVRHYRELLGQAETRNRRYALVLRNGELSAAIQARAILDRRPGRLPHRPAPATASAFDRQVRRDAGQLDQPLQRRARRP
ncbi:hypothetical protein [Egicoccus sp. AB-alg2]|uniref:hypothetical protein n=1 Tax=Egicoccus sp. AB-alg2 TaxID=3242693 RepID=UPI00359D7C92